MNDATIDAAVEQVVKTSGDRNALLTAVRGLADVLGYKLAPKPLPSLSVGDRVRATSGEFTGAVGTVFDIDPEYTAGPVLAHLDAGQCGRPYPVAHGFLPEELDPVPADDAVGYEPDPAPKPRDGERATCATCGGAIHYWEYSRWNGVDYDVIDSRWSHFEHPADGHDAVIGGPA